MYKDRRLDWFPSLAHKSNKVGELPWLLGDSALVGPARELEVSDALGGATTRHLQLALSGTTLLQLGLGDTANSQVAVLDGLGRLRPILRTFHTVLLYTLSNHHYQLHLGRGFC